MVPSNTGQDNGNKLFWCNGQVLCSVVPEGLKPAAPIPGPTAPSPRCVLHHLRHRKVIRGTQERRAIPLLNKLHPSCNVTLTLPVEPNDAVAIWPRACGMEEVQQPAEDGSSWAYHHAGVVEQSNQ